MDFKSIDIANTSFGSENMVLAKKLAVSVPKHFKKHNFMANLDSRKTFTGFKVKRIVDYFAY